MRFQKLGTEEATTKLLKKIDPIFKTRVSFAGSASRIRMWLVVPVRYRPSLMSRARLSRVRENPNRNQVTLKPMCSVYAMSFSCITLSARNCHVPRKKYEDWDTARLPKSRQGKSRGKGRVRTSARPSVETALQLIATSRKQKNRAAALRNKQTMTGSNYFQERKKAGTRQICVVTGHSYTYAQTDSAGYTQHIRRNSTWIPLYRSYLGADTADKPIPYRTGQKFGTLAGPVSS
ncbi:hypothetical protein T265_09711 [Opisthorchis viverrini]|uniref:Uncharacterized protein n=1 Tax=Opisthorchis viverrini TaxID=6198 RepID=A0A075A405_OPIVI|nr:hypothetical protein T265_09711 [Opisthorchis viverrini]KER22114.1 hypothetical protein T265_09711 [Opisthorchis viverrini]